MKPLILILGAAALAGLTALIPAVPHAPPAPPVPVRLADNDRWVADHGKADLVGFDYFDRLASQVWHLPQEQGCCGWAHSDVEWMTYRKAHVTVFFVLAAKPGVDDPAHPRWTFFGCSDSGTGRPIGAREADCRVGPVIRKD